MAQLLVYVLLSSVIGVASSNWKLDRDCIILVPKHDFDGNVAIRLAIQDVQRDFYKVLGAPPVVMHEPPPVNSPTRPWILFGRPSSASWLAAISQRPECSVGPDPEAHSICATHLEVNNGTQKVVASLGHDTRGAIFAAYVFSELILGVLPLWFFADCEPPYRGSVTIPNTLKVHFSADGFKFRAFFFNDEDLLGGFAKDPAGSGTMSISMYDALFEALLRLKGNAVIPGTAPFPDEPSLALATRRGLVLTQHHVTVCGLNTYRWPSPPVTRTHESPDQVTQQNVWLPCVPPTPHPRTSSTLHASCSLLQVFVLPQSRHSLTSLALVRESTRSMAYLRFPPLRRRPSPCRCFLCPALCPRSSLDRYERVLFCSLVALAIDLTLSLVPTLLYVPTLLCTTLLCTAVGLRGLDDYAFWEDDPGDGPGGIDPALRWLCCWYPARHSP
jgi:hypothetical protein